MNIKIPLRAKVSGYITLGPKPGTPEFEEEQRCKAEGRPYDYSACKRLHIIDEDPPSRVGLGMPDEGSPD
jgi:hypothetical protein